MSFQATQEHIDLEPTLEEAWAYIDTLDFSPIIQKLVREQGWLRSDALTLSKMYRHFLWLNKKYAAEAPLPPSEEIDEFWHNHILDTKKYRKDCDAIFGRYFDHYPYFGIDETTDFKDLGDAFQRMLQLYKAEFNEELYEVRSLFSRIAAFTKRFIKKKPGRQTTLT